MHRDSLSPFGNAARLAPAPSSTTCGGMTISGAQPSLRTPNSKLQILRGINSPSAIISWAGRAVAIPWRSQIGNAARLAPAPSSTTCGGSDDFGCSAISPDPQFEASDIERYKFSFGHYIVGRPRRCDPVAGQIGWTAAAVHLPAFYPARWPGGGTQEASSVAAMRRSDQPRTRPPRSA